MKASQIAAKIAVRLFFFLLVLGLSPLLLSHNEKLQHVYLIIPNKWLLIFPCLLVVGFISLFVLCSVKKYRETDFNWLLVLNTVILMIYGIMLFIRIYHYVNR